MDLDKSFISSILSGGKASLRDALDLGISSESLAGEGRTAFDFVVSYYKEYHSIPDVELIRLKTGVSLEDVSGDPRFFTDEILNRSLFRRIRGLTNELVEKLEAKAPVEALRALEDGVHSIRKERRDLSRLVSIGELAEDALAYYEKIKAGERGVLTPWPTINEATLGFWPEDLALFVARMGVGKCVKSDSLIVDPVTGVPQTIESLYRSPTSKTVSWEKNKGIVVKEISAKHDTGRKECLSFRLASGKVVEVTPEHPFLTAEGWRRADEIGEGSSIATPGRMPFPEKPVLMDDSELDILALLLAEGSVSGNHVSFSTSEPEILDIAKRAAEKLDCSLVKNNAYDYAFVSKSEKKVAGRNAVLNLTREWGIKGKRAKEKTLPDIVWRLGPQQLGRFLSLFWMCDGYVDRGVGMVLASEKMLKQIQSLLLRFGIQSSVRYKEARCEGKSFDAWRLRVYSEFLPEFDSFISLWGDKKERLSKLLGTGCSNPNVGSPTISSGLRDEILSLAFAERDRRSLEGRERLNDAMTKKLGWDSFTPKDAFSPVNTSSDGNKYSTLLGSFRLLCEEMRLSEYDWIFESEIFWDKIEKIDSIGEQKVYDLTVPGTNCFVANDVIVHNTWVEILIAREAWSAGKRVLFVTTEMASMRIAARLLSAHLKLPYGEFSSGKLGEFSEGKLKDAVKDLMEDTRFVTVGGFDFKTSTLAFAVEEAEPDIVLVDGAYLLKAEGGSRTERAAAVFDELKRMAKSAKVPFVVTTQFNRDAKSNVASSARAENIGLTDVAGWNADLIYGMVQTDDMKADKRMMFKPLKIREGVGKDIECHWNFETMDFSEIPSDEESGDEFSTGLEEIDESSLPKKESPGTVGLFKDVEEDEVPF